MFRDKLDHIPEMSAKFSDSISNNQAEMEGIQGQAMPCTDQPWGGGIGESEMSMVTLEEC